MKLDFLDDLTDNGKFPWADPGKLLRLYDFDYIEAKQLSKVVKITCTIEAGFYSALVAPNPFRAMSLR